jgi:hypothetical protein
MARSDSWSWTVFLNGFWRAFGVMMALFAVVYVVAIIFADKSAANFESAVTGIVFALLISGLWGYSAGDDEVRQWRSHRAETREDSN